MPEPMPNPEPPLVVRVDAEPPLVLPGVPPPPCQPGMSFGAAVLLTLGYLAALIAGMVAVILIALLLAWLSGRLQAGGGQQPDEAAQHLPPELANSLGWAIPAGYLAGLVYTLVALRVAAGRGWARQIGLARLSWPHLILGVLALPAFSIVSDGIRDVLNRLLDSFVFRTTGFGPLQGQDEALKEMFQGFHWSFAVFAIGVCPGVAEELWCRGFLSRGLLSRYGWLGGIALTSLLFGGLHMWPPSYILTTAVMGAMLHFAFATARSLWVPILLHLMNNSFAVLASLHQVPAEGLEHAVEANPPVVIGLAVATLLATGWAMWANRARLQRNAASGEPAPPLGIMDPRGAYDVTIARGRLHLLPIVAAAGCSAALLSVLFG